MVLQFFTQLLLLTQQALSVSNDDVILTPPSQCPSGNKTQVAFVFIQGAGIYTEQYLPLFQTLQQQGLKSSNCIEYFIGIPGFLLATPDPLRIGADVSNIYNGMKQKGLDADAPVFVGAHSLGTVFLQSYAIGSGLPFKPRGQVLMGGALLRSDRENYPLSTLTIDGELDGQYRITRQAESYYFQVVNAPNDTYAYKDYPVVIIDGMTHMQFASGDPPSTVKSNDLKPEISYDQAHQAVAQLVNNYILAQLFNNSQAENALKQSVQHSSILLNPLIAAFKLEAFFHFQKPCNSDHVLPSYCPEYPRYPGGDTSDEKDTDCTCGTPWSATAHDFMSGFSNNSNISSKVTLSSRDAIHSVSDVLPIHLPYIFQNCTETTQTCEVKVTTVTEAIYSTFDSLDTGFYYASASELRTKMKSRQTLQVAAGYSDADFNQTDDGALNICASINELALKYGQDNAPQRTKDRYNKIGQQMVTGDDKGPYNAGPLWIYNDLEYNESSDKQKVVVQAPYMATPKDYWISSAAGFHYCKLLSPARVMEWMYIDGLRLNGSLKEDEIVVD